MDSRDRAALGHFYRFNESNMKIIFDDEDDDGNEIELELPAKYEVCSLCDGKGHHVNPSIDAHGLSREDFDEDPGFAEDYLSGMYDELCYECGGKRVQPVVNEEYADKETLERFKDRERSEADYIRECEYERRMGC